MGEVQVLQSSMLEGVNFMYNLEDISFKIELSSVLATAQDTPVTTHFP
jgi:hypothetical protein